jgi:hypothetical protein
MPTATWIARSSLIVTSLVAPSDRQEVNCNSKDASCCQLRVSSSTLCKKKIQGLKERSVAKKSQPIIKASIKKKCNFEGCINQARGKGGVCHTHGAKRKRCTFEGCTKGVIKGGVCVTHGATTKRCTFEGCTKYADREEESALHMAQRRSLNVVASRDVSI